MPAIMIEFTSAELAELHAEADEVGLSVSRLARDVLVERLHRLRQRRSFVRGAVKHALEIKPHFDEVFPEGWR